jgi:hypothetical protein
MEPIRFDGPSVDISVERRLRRLNPKLKLTWSPYALDHSTGRPIEMVGMMDPLTGERPTGPLKDPAYYLWLKDDSHGTHWLVGIYPHFGHEQLMHLEADVARHMDHGDVFDLLQAKAQNLRDRALTRRDDRKRGEREANRKRIHDLVFEGKTGYRDAKVSSYAGQTNRQSSGERKRFLADAREDGWELSEEPTQ